MKLGYVCTNFNNSHFTVDAVRSLVASARDRHHLQIVVVDNLSTDAHRATLIELSKEFSCVEVLLNEANVGYFRGLNCGIRHLRNKYPDYEALVVGNNDLLFATGFCDQVEANTDLLDAHAVISPDIVTLDGEHQNPHVISSISKWREVVYDLYYSSYLLAQCILWLAKVSRRFTDRSDESNHSVAQHIYQGHGSCYLIGRKFFQHFDEFWAPTFLMGEEYFLSKQLSDQGLKVFYSPSVQVTHCCHGSLQTVHSKRIWELARDAHSVYRKHVKVLG